MVFCDPLLFILVINDLDLLKKAKFTISQIQIYYLVTNVLKNQ